MTEMFLLTQSLKCKWPLALALALYLAISITWRLEKLTNEGVNTTS